MAKRQDKETDPEMIQILELEDTCFKATNINIFKDLKDKAVLMNKQFEEWKLLKKWKFWFWNVFDINSSLNGVNSILKIVEERVIEPKIRSSKNISNKQKNR